MFDISWGELLIIGIVALVVIGPKELPGVLRATGQWMGKIRRMASDFQDQFREAMREAEMDDIKKKVDEMSNPDSSFTNFDPIGTVRKEIESLTKDPLADSATSAAPEATAPEVTVPDVPTPEPTEFAAPEPDPAQIRKAGEGV
jgi:sec-independent protein translocase protein TatB